MKILIAGFGSIGRRHFRNLLALGMRDIIFYRTGKSTLPVRELDGFIVENDLGKAMNHYPDAVIVANPTALHLEVAIPAAEAGCHLLLEKPISYNMDRVGEFEEIINKRGVRVLVGFQFRFHPNLQKIRDILGSGAIGKPISAYVHWGELLSDWHPWEDYKTSYASKAALGGGVVLTLCHPFDYLRWLFGEVTGVWGATRPSEQLTIDVEDRAEAGLEFASGIFASVQLDFLQAPPTHHLQVNCERGAIEWNGDTGLVLVTMADGREEQLPAPVGFERNDLFYSEMQHFLDLANGEADSLCTLPDGIRALEIALAVHRSAEAGRKVNLNG